jgi:hypothetical protein
MADEHRIVFARRGKAERNEALTQAIERARQNFLRRWKKPDVIKATSIQSTVPSQSAGLQVIDYYLWALQRLVERREDRFYAALASQYRLVMDLDDTRLNPYGTWYSDRSSLELERMKPVTSS